MNSAAAHLVASLGIWTEALQEYSKAQLTHKPSLTAWSIGQVYVHIITNTQFFLEQAELCLKSEQNQSEMHSAEAAKMFENNAFPDLILEGPDENADTPQPSDKTVLKKSLEELVIAVSIVAGKMAIKDGGGKTKHPGLGYFSAVEWMRFAEMHIRHHLRQKKRLDHFLSDADIIG